jgi:predicted PurR-regulated permease PerM
MKIINLYKNLQERERKLVLISFVLIIFLILYFSFMNVYSSYTRSSINLAKAKSDYEYVYNKVKLFESSNNKKNLSSENIERIIIDNSFQDNITDLNITEKNSSIYISLLSTNISDAVTLSEKLVNSSNREITNIKYENFNNKVSAELIFN